MPAGLIRNAGFHNNTSTWVMHARAKTRLHENRAIVTLCTIDWRLIISFTVRTVLPYLCLVWYRPTRVEDLRRTKFWGRTFWQRFSATRPSPTIRCSTHTMVEGFAPGVQVFAFPSPTLGIRYALALSSKIGGEKNNLGDKWQKEDHVVSGCDGTTIFVSAFFGGLAI